MMTESMTRNHWWLGITKDVEIYVNGCDLYWKIKNYTEVPAEKLMENNVRIEDSRLYLFPFLIFIFISSLFFILDLSKECDGHISHTIM